MAASAFAKNNNASASAFTALLSIINYRLIDAGRWLARFHLQEVNTGDFRFTHYIRKRRYAVPFSRISLIVSRHHREPLYRYRTPSSRRRFEYKATMRHALYRL